MAGYPQPPILRDQTQAFRIFCRIPTAISWDALTRWCFTHSKRGIYFVKKTKPESHGHVPLLGILPLGTGRRVASGSVELPQPQLLPEALPVTRTQKLMDRSCLLNISLRLLGRRSAVAPAHEGDDALSSPSVTEDDAERRFLEGKVLQSAGGAAR